MNNLSNHLHYQRIDWYTRDDVNFVYIPINRCASNWMTTMLLENDFYVVAPVDRNKVASKDRIVILREPVERVISGMFINENYDLSILDNQIDYLLFSSTLDQDVHTIGQAMYLPHEDHSKFVFFKFEEYLPAKIEDFMTSQGIKLKPGSMPWLKPLMTTGPRSMLHRPIGATSKENREKVYRDPKLLNMFRTYLKEDYKLYNSVEWYGTN